MRLVIDNGSVPQVRAPVVRAQVRVLAPSLPELSPVLLHCSEADAAPKRPRRLPSPCGWGFIFALVLNFGLWYCIIWGAVTMMLQ